MDCSPPGSSAHGIFPGNKTGLSCHFLLQEIFPTQGSNPNLLHWQADPLPLSHQGSAKMFIYVFIWLHWIAARRIFRCGNMGFISPPGIEPGPPALGAQRLTLWTTREGPTQLSVQFSSVTQLCPTLCDPMDCSMPGFSVHHQLPELTQTHVH